MAPWDGGEIEHQITNTVQHPSSDFLVGLGAWVLWSFSVCLQTMCLMSSICAVEGCLVMKLCMDIKMLFEEFNHVRIHPTGP